MKKSLTIINNQVEFLHFLRTKFPLYHLSNCFFRDLHYGVIDFFSYRKQKISYGEAEHVARAVAQHFEKQNIFRKVNQQGWVLLYPEFITKKAS